VGIIIEALNSESDEPRLRCSHLALTEIYRVSWLIDDALSSAARASKAASRGVDKRFDEAVRALGKYEERFDPK
jgi:hypothetical protein